MTRASAFVLALLLSGGAAAASADPPRLFRVIGDGADGAPVVFYLLGVTHNGHPVEYDEYFDEAVLPVFRSIGHYTYENAVVSTATIGACPRPLTSRRGIAALAVLRARLADVVVRVHEAVDRKASRTRTAGFWQEFADRYAGGVAEYGLPLEIRSQDAMLAFLDGRAEAVAMPAREPVAKALEALRPETLAASLDAPEDVVEAYCDSGEGRVAYLENALERDGTRAGDPPSQATIDREMEEGRQAFLATFRAHRLVGVLADSAQFSESLVCKRNATWIGRMTHPDAAGPWFYAVGVAHLFAAAGPTASCAGLLEDLGRMGFSVHPVLPSSSARST